ncbi:MAG: serine/threonine-protein kinase [bacterium]
MADTSWPRIKQVFLDALDRPAAERAAFLRAAVGDDAAALGELEEMLAAHEDTGSLEIERKLAAAAAAPLEGAAREGDRLGPWRLLRRLGEGGMGEVWLGERADGQFEQRVAVKLVRHGYHAAEMISRFSRERRILARLEHPNIARLLDGGVAPDGRPYLVMEYVDGAPITRWCAARGLDVRARVALFLTVCDAVSFAHARLVVHRDLKPANILVGEDGRPKLLDFGIAKLLESDPDEDEAAATRPIDRVLTPEHAAPEQLRGEAVSAATDVWGLGVLLYELLTGERPYRFPTRSPTEIERILAERNAPPPSAAVAAGSLRKTLRGDLDAVALSALRKSVAERYPSARELAEDLECWLHGRPVHAVRPSFAYRARKFVRRHLVPVVSGVALATLLVAFAVSSRLQSRRVAVERDRARAEQAKAERAVDMLVGIFQSSNPTVTPGADTLRVSDLLDRTEGQVDALSDQPDLQSRLWQVLAGVSFVRSRPAHARELFERALDARRRAGEGDDLESAHIQHVLARITLTEKGRKAAVPLFRDSLVRLRRLTGDHSVDVGVALQDLGGTVDDDAEAIRLLDESLAVRRSLVPPDTTGVAATLNALAVRQWNAHDLEAADSLFTQSLAILSSQLPADHPNVMALRNNLAAVSAQHGDFAKAERMQRELLADRRRTFGDSSIDAAESRQALGVALASQGRFTESREALSEAYRVLEKCLGRANDEVAAAAQDLARAYVLEGNASRGAEVLSEALAIASRAHGADSPEAATFASAHAVALAEAGNPEPAVAEARRALATLERSTGTEPGSAEWARGNLGLLLLATGRPDEAEPLLRRAEPPGSDTSVAHRAVVAGLRCALAASLVGQRRFEEARPLFAQNLPVFRAWRSGDPLLRTVVEGAMSTLDAERRHGE